MAAKSYLAAARPAKKSRCWRGRQHSRRAPPECLALERSAPGDFVGREVCAPARKDPREEGIQFTRRHALDRQNGIAQKKTGCARPIFAPAGRHDPIEDLGLVVPKVGADDGDERAAAPAQDEGLLGRGLLPARAHNVASAVFVTVLLRLSRSAFSISSWAPEPASVIALYSVEAASLPFPCIASVI